MEQITIIGSNTLLGKHLVKLIEETTPTISIKIWDNDWSLYEALHNSDVAFNLHEYQDFSLVPNIEKMQKNNVEFVNELIEKCKLAGCKLLVHLSTTYLQCSTKWPNVWGRESEMYWQKYRRECPFPEYCESKFEAEQLIGYADQFTRIIARVGALYGEDDCHSLVCDSILGTQKFGIIPRISDPKRMGVFQFTYAANAADALFSCAQKMLSNMEMEEGGGEENEKKQKPKAHPCETVIICDNTPLDNLYSLLLEPIIGKKEEKKKMSDIGAIEKDKNVEEVPLNEMDKMPKSSPKGIDIRDGIGRKKRTASAIEEVDIAFEDGKNMKKEENDEDGKEDDHPVELTKPTKGNGGGGRMKNIRLSHFSIPFSLFFFPYWLLCTIIWILNQIFGIQWMNTLPSPNYVYLLLRHWTFYSGYKLRIFFNWRPPYDWPTSLAHSREYYRQLKADKVSGPSWLPNPNDNWEKMTMK